MKSKIYEIIKYAIGKSPIFSHKKIEDIHLVRAREGEFIWQVFLSPKNTQPECILVKAIKPKRKHLAEIMLYRKNPPSLRPFFPTIYDVIKKYGFYWFLLERLRQLPLPAISLENFKKPIELIVSLHGKYYSDSSIMTNKQINWVPHFKNLWQKRMNRLELIIKFRKYLRCAETEEILKEDKILLRNTIQNSRKVLGPLLEIPHSLIHGCLEYHHICTSFDESKPAGLCLIDWENLSFAPVTLDLIYLLEKSIDHGTNNNVNISQFRYDCLNYYCTVMKDRGINILESKVEESYNITLLFKIISQFTFEELKKIKKGKPSNYNFYRNQLVILGKSLKLIR